MMSQAYNPSHFKKAVIIACKNNSEFSFVVPLGAIQKICDAWRGQGIRWGVRVWQGNEEECCNVWSHTCKNLYNMFFINSNKFVVHYRLTYLLTLYVSIYHSTSVCKLLLIDFHHCDSTDCFWRAWQLQSKSHQNAYCHGEGVLCPVAYFYSHVWQFVTGKGLNLVKTQKVTYFWMAPYMTTQYTSLTHWTQISLCLLTASQLLFAIPSPPIPCTGCLLSELAVANRSS